MGLWLGVGVSDVLFVLLFLLLGGGGGTGG